MRTKFEFQFWHCDYAKLIKDTLKSVWVWAYSMNDKYRMRPQIVIGKQSGYWVRMDWLVKNVYLTLTKNGFPIFPSLFHFVVWELINCMSITV